MTSLYSNSRDSVDDEDITDSDRVVVINALAQTVIVALLPLYHRNALTADERDRVYDARDILDALLARGHEEGPVETEPS